MAAPLQRAHIGRRHKGLLALNAKQRAQVLLDGALLLFFLPYTVAFNWVYDTQRAHRLQRLAQKRTTAKRAS